MCRMPTRIAHTRRRTIGIATPMSAPSVAPFGTTPDGRAVEVHRFANTAGMEVSVLSLGGTIRTLCVPDRHGVVADVTPGYDGLADYLADTRYFGAIIGRYANRIARGRFMLDGVACQLTRNDGANQLHGGSGGFHRAIWAVEPLTSGAGTGVVLSHTSPSGAEGFPGTLTARITYTLTDANELLVDYLATTDHATPVNLTQHAYFNLAGHGSGDILDHELTIHASRYLPVRSDLIPTGEVSPVEGTPFDFRAPRAIRPTRAAGGAPPFIAYDHNFVIDGATSGVVRPVARLHEPRSGRTLEIDSSEPGLQFYAGGMIGRDVAGKDGAYYQPNSALALETQHFPDSPNQPHFPSTILRPGATYRSRTVYRFGSG